MACGAHCNFTTTLQTQQAISALYRLMQADAPSHWLVAKVTEAASNSKQALQRIYALYDGKKQSEAIVPDIQIFASNSTGSVTAPGSQTQHYILHLSARWYAKQPSMSKALH